MYHGVGNDEQTEGSDPHYRVTEETFLRHLSLIKNSVSIERQFADSKSINTHAITFDDGHISNYEVAFPLLLEKRMTADFYVNSDSIGTKNYISWPQLKEMAQAGMSIQSHGHEHKYISDLSEQEITKQLDYSKKLIEDKLGNSVFVFAPPGGRYDDRVVEISKSLGYKLISSSIPGVVPKSKSFILPRFAVTHNTSDSKISNWQNRLSLNSIFEVSKYQILKNAKKVFGNKSYEKVRAILLRDNQEWKQ